MRRMYDKVMLIKDIIKDNEVSLFSTYSSSKITIMLSNEALARQEADASLLQGISDEASARDSADNELQDQIDDLFDENNKIKGSLLPIWDGN